MDFKILEEEKESRRRIVCEERAGEEKKKTDGKNKMLQMVLTVPVVVTCSIPPLTTLPFIASEHSFLFYCNLKKKENIWKWHFKMVSRNVLI